MPRVSAGRLTSFVARVLDVVGTPRDVAQRVAEHTVDANLTGHDSHGVLRLEGYLDHVEIGYVDPAAQPTIIRETSTTALIDGEFAWGPVVADFAMETAIEKATEHSLSAVSIYRAYHIGRLGPYLLQATRRGYIGIAFCNVHGSARAAPWGGTQRRLPTNPIAFAIPTSGKPILTDFATTAVAEGKVRAAKITGQQVPAGWVLDGEGRPSCDPNDLYGEGSLANLGGDQGHKGYSLAVAMDLLGGVLSGIGTGLMSSERYGNGVLFQVLDPAAFTDPAEYKQRIDKYAAYLRSARRREGVDEIFLPGEIEDRRSAERRRSGLEVPDPVWERLSVLSERYGVALPPINGGAMLS